MRLSGFLALIAACGGRSAAKDAASGAEPPGIDAPSPVLEQIHYYGRWDAMHAAGWPGSTIATRFSGTQIQATIHESGDDWLEITVDGTARPALHLTNGTQMYTLVTGLTAGDHDLVIAKRTESYVGTTRFDGFVGATLVDTARATRVIEIIGDSISAGYGVLGASATCSFSAATEAEPHAWGALAATELGAAHQSIAYSGIGMYRNCCGGTGSTTDTMPLKYARQLADQASPAWDFHVVPNVIVIALGTNDFSGSDPGQPFVDAYERFITDAVRAHAPDAPILLATSPMLSGQARAQHRAYLDAIVAHFADPRITVVDIPEQLSTDGFGCDYHPNETTARKSAAALVPAVRAATGW